MTPGNAFSVAAERAYGALWGALGLGSLRQFGQDAQQLASASAEEAAAQAACAWVAAQAWNDSLQRLALVASQRGADQPLAAATPTALLRQWIGILDAATHAAMQSQSGLQATAATVRASSRRRLAQQRLLDLGTESLGLPTRREVDETFREIQELKREVRRLRRAGEQLPQESTHG